MTNVKTFRKKPVVIQACQFVYDKQSIGMLQTFCVDALGDVWKARHPNAKAEAFITLHVVGKYESEKRRIIEGDWIIKMKKAS